MCATQALIKTLVGKGYTHITLGAYLSETPVLIDPSTGMDDMPTLPLIIDADLRADGRIIREMIPQKVPRSYSSMFSTEEKSQNSLHHIWSREVEAALSSKLYWYWVRNSYLFNLRNEGEN